MASGNKTVKRNITVFSNTDTGEITSIKANSGRCPKCESDYPISTGNHTVSDLSDGNWHELKDGRRLIIQDPFSIKKEHTQDIRVRLGVIACAMQQYRKSFWIYRFLRRLRLIK
jgi:hypothetical protein